MGDRIKDLIGGVIIIGTFAAVHLLHSQIPIVIYFTLLFGILFHAQVLATRLFPKVSWLASVGMGAVVFFAIQSLTQTVFFYLNAPLDAATFSWTTFITMCACQVLQLVLGTPEAEIEEFHPPTTRSLLLGVTLVAISISVLVFVVMVGLQHATSDSIRSPWLVLPGAVYAAIGVSWLAVLIGSWLVPSRTLASIQAGLALLSTTVITPLVYRIGFGFDGFLHVASEKILLTTGTLSPKPLYYIGQYVFTTWLAQSANVPIGTVDRWLVPVAAAILIPFALAMSLDEKKQATWFAALFFLPLAAFIATTPQAFAYVLGMTALIFSLGVSGRRVNPLVPFIIAAWAVAVHPLAGLPFFFLTLMSVSLQWRGRRLFLARLIGGLSALASAVAVPSAFVLMSQLKHDGVHWDFGRAWSWPLWQKLFLSLAPWIGNHFTLWASWGSLVAQASFFILVLFALATCSMKTERRALWIGLLVSSLLLAASSVLLKAAGDFAFLIDYERGNYAERLLVLAAFAIFPAALPAFGMVFEKIRARGPLVGLAAVLFFFALAAGQAYAALPRHDALVIGRGWSVGAADMEAVRFIDRDAAGKAYGVLANQSVSAAAVSQLGFKRYAYDDVFFYPIPTGGPLYDIYLKLTYGEPSTDLIKDAGRLTESQIVYVAINDYWWNAEMVDESLHALANDEWVFGDEALGLGHAVRVYKFDLSALKSASQAAPTR